MEARGIEITLASVRSSIGFIRKIALGIFNLDLGFSIALEMDWTPEFN